MGDMPTTERQARELAPLSADLQQQAWNAALKLCANGKPTARQIAAVVNAMGPPGAPSPKEARRIAIETGKSVLDSEGWYQPPITIEQQEELNEPFDLLDEVVSFTESPLLKHRPADLLTKFLGLYYQESSRLRRISLDSFISWLTEFENERKKNCR
jgi:hypothetical protein